MYSNNENSIINKTNGIKDTDIYFQGKEDNQEVEEDINVVSGMRIIDDVDTSGNNDLLSLINNANKSYVEESEKERENNEKKLKEEYEAEILKRQEELLAKRAEEEAKERERIRKEEEEALRLEEEAKQSKKKKKDDNLEDEKGTNVVTETVKDVVSNIDLTQVKIPTINNPLKGMFNGGRNKGFSNKNDDDIEISQEKPNKQVKEKEPKKEKENKNFFKKNEKENKVEDTYKPTKEEIKWKEKATHDELTGLKNSLGLEEDLKDFKLDGAIIFADLNNLKYINDTLGHAAGNTLLKECGKVLTKCFENTYRIGGDEFIILTDNKESQIKKKISIIHKTFESLTKNDKSGIIYSISIGVAIGDGKKSIEELKEIADEEMYKEKEAYKKAHPETNIRDKDNIKDNEDTDWKSLAMIDQKTKLYNKLALSMHKVRKSETIALIRIPLFSNLKRDEGDKQIELLSEIIKNTLNDNDQAFFIENGTFVIIYANKKTSLEEIKKKARTLSLGTEMTTLTESDKKIEDIISILEQKLNNKNQVEEPKTYDERLSLSQRRMKEAVKQNHEVVQEEDFEQMLQIIQKKANDIISLFMTSKDFNVLFIFFDVYDFLENIYQIQDSIDFSYVYVVYPGGALYYGSDEYSSDISDLFQKIADGLQTGTTVTPKDIQKIEGINIFEKIYIQ